MALERWPVAPEWRAAIDGFLTAARAAGAPPTTLDTRRQHLEHAARGLEGSPWAVTGARLIEWTAGREWARETRRGRRSTFRAFWRWGVAGGHALEDAAAALPSVRAAAPSPRPLPAVALETALDGAGDRVRLILRLAVEVGMRRGEIARAHSSDLEADLVGWSLRVHGKGGRERVVPLDDGLAATLRGLGRGYFFPGREDGHLSARYVGKLATTALPGAWTLHAGRHRFATLAHRQCGDLLIVQDLLGHASPATTRAYVGPDDARARAVVTALASAHSSAGGAARSRAA